MLTHIRLSWLLRKANKHALLMDRLGWQSLNKEHFKKRDELQTSIRKIQEQTHTVAAFNAVIKEWFPEVAMMRLGGHQKIERLKI